MDRASYPNPQPPQEYSAKESAKEDLLTYRSQDDRQADSLCNHHSWRTEVGCGY
ncbi:hypothetical protein J5O04_08880 [Corynebacterium hindlerae]|uniref:hypothetical protein n=1 Tax=Corynebacterium hindlerae TaxID=699041 RepID=UPI001AD65444|nr:hypothetical protein [Corynebacterium hindlerae]QTH58928.1 hypothetical protein J5O04_08880 [Corynebacterium hindlerae]